MDEITLDDKTYVSSKRAAQITGYAKDYVGQLCREGRVEARLVGRNWYVLESSIREHRFGVETPLSPEISADKSLITNESLENEPVTSDAPAIPISPLDTVWESPNYSNESSPSLLPTLNSQERAPEINVLDKYSPSEAHDLSKSPENLSAIKEMQSAWHDWFVRTNEFGVSRETLLENPEISQNHRFEGVNEIVPLRHVEQAEANTEAQESTKEELLEEGVTGIRLEKLSEPVESQSNYSEDSFGEEESVPIHRSLPRSPSRTSQSSVYSNGKLRRDVFAKVSAKGAGRIVSERRLKTRQNPSMLLQVMFLLIAGLAIIVAVIGSGKLDAWVSPSHANYAPIQYISGERVLIENNK